MLGQARNRVIVHVRPVIDREVVVHRTNTIVRDVVLHRIRTINSRNVYRRQVFNVWGGETVRHVTVHRWMRGVNCGCGYERREVVSYRD